MEINKTIRIGDISETITGTFDVEIRNILDIEKYPDHFRLIYWNTDDCRKAYAVFLNCPITWYDKDGNKSRDYQKLVDTLSVYAEQAKLKDAIAGLD